MHAEPLSSIDLPSHFEAITHALDALAPMEPDPARVDEIWRRFRDEVLAKVDAELRILSPDDRDALEATTAMLANELASLLDATGDRLACSEARRAARHFARTEDLGREVEASEADPAGYRTLLAARAAYRQELFGTGDALLKKLQTTSPALRTLAEKALDGLRPMTGAPSLFTFNSVGTMLWGARDRWPDGTYVATLCAVVAFMPVFPIAAYRVSDEGGGRYAFYAKTRLSRFARLVQVGVVASVVLGLAGLVGFSWWQSPARRAAVAMEEAGALEGPARLVRYEQVLGEYGQSAAGVVAPAALALVDDALSHVEEPMTALRVDEAERVVLRVESLPAGQHQVTPRVIQALERWRAQVGGESLDDAEAGARLAAAVSRLSGGARAYEVERDAALAVADRLRDEWPLAALDRYSDHAAFPSAAARMVPIVDRLEDDATWCAVGPAIERWLPYADERASVVRGKLEAARARCASPDRKVALDGGEPELRAALEATPGDLGLRAALADTLRFEGKLEEARAVFGEVAPGWLPPDALVSYAMLQRDLGEIDAAAHLLDRHVKDHLPRYQRAIRAYDAFADGLFEQIDESYTRRGEPELEERLRYASEEEAPEIFQAYVLERLAGHGRVVTLRDEIDRESSVVPAALALGMLQLERASGREGDERDALVRDAERVFLAIRQDAEGAAEFHLGLGQVHHRLGRREEGDAELSALADRDPSARLAVADVYRQLHLHDLAQSHARRAYEEGDDELQGSAAMLLAHLATELEEEDRWWQAAPQDLPAVRLGLLSVRGERALREGNYDLAATRFREVAEAHAERADHDPISANNAALAWGQVYAATGEDAVLERAVELLEQSVRRQPDDAIAVSNLATFQVYRGHVRLLSAHVRTNVLRLDPPGARRLVDVLLAGSAHDEVVEAMRRDPSLRRASELWRRAIVLSPTMEYAYHYEIERASALGDHEGARAMRERMQQVDFDASGGRTHYEASWRGEHDEVLRTEVMQGLTRAEAALAAAERSEHARTILAAKLLVADATFAAAGTLFDRELATRSAALYAEITADGFFDPYLVASPRLLEAVLKANEASPALRRRWAERHRLGVVLFVAELRAHPEERDAVRARPEATASAELFRQHGNGGDLVLWALGDALGHAGLIEANVAAKSDPVVRERVEGEAQRSPWRRDLQVQLGWF